MAAIQFLPVLDTSTLTFEAPVKKIYDGPDVESFLTSLAYRDIMTFMLQLNWSVVPDKQADGKTVTHPTNDIPKVIPPTIQSLQHLIEQSDALIEQAPPDTGPRRFGNISFRKWYQLLEERFDDIVRDLQQPMPGPALTELKAYFFGSFGSAQRLDYGTGHELSFLAFLACLWKIGYFTSKEANLDQQAEVCRLIVLVVFEQYLVLVRKLIKVYNLEPAGSHGVWGLDDNSFLPYVFGSAQLCPAIDKVASEPTPLLGSIPSAPSPDIVTTASLIDKEKNVNMYFSAIAFIHSIKRGPFWEHSPVLYDISGIKDGWGKINKGMIKMYQAEVLAKFPVVQHFPFGSLLKFDRDSEAKPIAVSTHTSSQPLRNPVSAGDHNAPTSMRSPLNNGAMGSGSRPTGFVNGVTQAPWARAKPAGFVDGVTKAPWAKSGASTAAFNRPAPRTGGVARAPVTGRQPPSVALPPRGKDQAAPTQTQPNSSPDTITEET